MFRVGPFLVFRTEKASEKRNDAQRFAVLHSKSELTAESMAPKTQRAIHFIDKTDIVMDRLYGRKRHVFYLSYARKTDICW